MNELHSKREESGRRVAIATRHSLTLAHYRINWFAHGCNLYVMDEMSSMRIGQPKRIAGSAFHLDDRLVQYGLGNNHDSCNMD